MCCAAPRIRRLFAPPLWKRACPDLIWGWARRAAREAPSMMEPSVVLAAGPRAIQFAGRASLVRRRAWPVRVQFGCEDFRPAPPGDALAPADKFANPILIIRFFSTEDRGLQGRLRYPFRGSGASYPHDGPASSGCALIREMRYGPPWRPAAGAPICWLHVSATKPSRGGLTGFAHRSARHQHADPARARGRAPPDRARV